MIDFTPFFTSDATQSLDDWRRRYEVLGMVTIPLKGKSPLDPVSWKTTPSMEQWRSSGRAFTGNIGVILGNGIAVIDADDLKTASLVDDGLKTIGISPAAVSTPRGRHFYLRVAGVPDGFNYSRLAAGVYKGELRARNSYVVAPGSQVNGVPYRWTSGSPEELQQQTVVEWKDLNWLLPDRMIVPRIEQLPIRLIYRDMPQRARVLLEELSYAVKGQAVDKYESRSEAEAAVMATLILAGWTYDQILSTFDHWKPGKYRDCGGRDRQRYFDTTYFRVLSKLAAHPARQQIAYTWQQINTSTCWPGSNGFLQRDTLRGLLAVAWQYGLWEISASERDLAEYAAASQSGIHNALKALSKREIIEKVPGRNSFGHGNRWTVKPAGRLSSEVMIYDDFSTEESHDVVEIWSQAKLGRTAGIVYRLLNDEPVSISHLSRRTSKARSTIALALTNKLANLGLAEKVEQGWIRGNADLIKVAEQLETRLSADKRRSYHKRERELFAELLLKRQKSGNSKWK